MQARHFVNACARYFFDVAVGETWVEFMAYLDGVEAAMQEEDEMEPDGMRDVGGVDELRRRHEACLDKMLFGLLLRHRQTKVMTLLEEIFSAVLGFEKMCLGTIMDADIIALHGEFAQKVTVFLEVCRGLGGKKGYGVEGGKENSIERLVLGIDFNGFHSKKR